MRTLFVLAIIGLSIGNANAQAFGLWPGDGVRELTKFFDSVRNNAGIYDAVPPQPRSIFGRYSVTVAPRLGICSITAYAQYNNPIRSEFAFKRIVSDLLNDYPDVEPIRAEALVVEYGELPDGLLSAQANRFGNEVALRYQLLDGELCQADIRRGYL